MPTPKTTIEDIKIAELSHLIRDLYAGLLLLHNTASEGYIDSDEVLLTTGVLMGKIEKTIDVET